MQVSHLSLKDFRNYAEGDFLFAPGMNVLIGRNGQGKTNVAEAIMYLATLRSHRVAQDAALIRADHDAAIIRCKLQQEAREALLEVQLNRSTANKFLINRHTVRPRELSRMISAVLFAPEDLAMIRGEPSLRRRFLDDALMSRHPVAAGAIADYERVLRQRNTLLRDAKHSRQSQGFHSVLDAWDEQLVTLGAQILAHRRMLVRDLREPLTKSYLSLVEHDHQPRIRLSESFLQDDVSRETQVLDPADPQYVSRETIAAELRDALRVVRPRELERGQTLVGPHRDDLELELRGLPVKGYASHGETWSFALALKLALAVLLRQDSGTGDPVLILDDVFAELDADRRARLYGVVTGFEQVIVTAAVEEDLPGGGEWHRIYIHDGAVVGGLND